MNKILILFIFLITSQYSKTQNIEKHDFYLAKAHLFYNQIDSSLLCANNLLSKEANNIKYLLLLAEIQFKAYNFTESLNTYLKINEQKNGIVDYNIAQCYASINNKEKAIEFLKIYLQKSDKNYQAFIKLDKAFENINKSSEWNQLWLEEWYNKYEISLFDAEYLISKKQYHDAIELLTQIIEKKSKSHKAYFLRAKSSSFLGNYRAAITDLDKAISLYNKTDIYYFYRGLMNNYEKKYKKALLDFDSAIKLNSDNIEYFFERAKANYYNSNINSALEDINFYITYRNCNSEAYYFAGLIYNYKHDYLDALVNLNIAINNDTSKYDYFTQRGNAYLNSSTYKLAENDFNMSLDLNPTQSEAWLNRGIARFKQGNTVGACSDWEKAFNLKNVNAVDYLKSNCWK